MRDIHDEMRELIALGDSLSGAQQEQLRAHLQDCADCRSYAETAVKALQALRSVNIAAGTRLVHATQTRVRFHAARLREARERMWLVGLACLAVGLSATLTAPLLWRLFAWIGESMGLSALVWQTGFAVFFIAPALVVSLLLIARGAHLSDQTRNWK